MDIMTILIWIGLGAIGGFIHWILPTPNDKPNDIVQMAKRIIAGAIVVPIVMSSATYFNIDILKFGVIGQIFLGYFAIEILRTLRNLMQNKNMLSMLGADDEEP